MVEYLRAEVKMEAMSVLAANSIIKTDEKITTTTYHILPCFVDVVGFFWTHVFVDMILYIGTTFRIECFDGSGIDDSMVWWWCVRIRARSVVVVALRVAIRSTCNRILEQEVIQFVIGVGIPDEMRETHHDGKTCEGCTGIGNQTNFPDRFRRIPDQSREGRYRHVSR